LIVIFFFFFWNEEKLQAECITAVLKNIERKRKTRLFLLIEMNKHNIQHANEKRE
jgi:hypothetical protein